MKTAKFTVDLWCCNGKWGGFLWQDAMNKVEAKESVFLLRVVKRLFCAAREKGWL